MTDVFDQLTARASRTQDGPPTPATPDQQSSDSRGARASTTADSYTPRQLKDVVLELLKYGVLESQKKPNLFRDAIAQQQAINRILEPLDLALRLDEIRGLAYIVVAQPISESESDEWSHPLVRRQRLNLEQSLLIAILRQQFIAHEQQAGVGATDALIAIEDLLPHLEIYLGDLGSDAQEQKRLRNLLEQLRAYGIVSEIDEHDRIAIRPIIAHLANPENLQALLSAFREEARNPASAADDTRTGEGEP